jgi:N-acetylglutamate synthase-like GNAT family acetyltransferase
MSALILQSARPDDWDTIAALLHSHRLPLAGAREHLSTFVVARQGERIVACAGAEPHGDAVLLRSVAVADSHQGQGLGRRLVGEVLDQARRRQFESVYLLTTTAAGYFRALGFEPVARAQAPHAMAQSAEFTGACPAEAVLMVRALHEPAGGRADTEPPGPVGILGAGPVGLAAAAHLAARGLPFWIVEAGPRVGTHLLEYGHVRLFSPWRFNIDPVMADALKASGWAAPDPEALPTARDVVTQVLEPFAQLPAIQHALHLDTRVTAVSRQGLDKVRTAGRRHAPFVVQALRGGRPVTLQARALIDATGTWGQPNPLGPGGVPVPGEAEARDHIVHGLPDVLGSQRSRYANRKVVVAGSGHSAAHNLLALDALAREAPQTSVVWLTRSAPPARAFGGGSADALPARGAMGEALRHLTESGRVAHVCGLRVTRVEHDVAAAAGPLRIVGVDAQGQPQTLDGIDEIIVATGQRPDLDPTRELRLTLDSALESCAALGPLIDPNVHSCGTVRPHGHRELSHAEPNFYTVGVKSYGRAPTFLMATGFEQVRSVVAALAGDLAAADRVELELPETGVCSGLRIDEETASPWPKPASPAPTAAECSASDCGEVAPLRVSPAATPCCG